MSSTNRWICFQLIFIFIADSGFGLPAQDNVRSEASLGCSAEILRFTECSPRCNDDHSCLSRELRNFITACMSGNTQNCTEPTQPKQPQSEPPQPKLSPATMPPPVTIPSRVKCGIENEVQNRDQRIINGVKVNVPRKYSWQVGLKKYDKEGTYNCGGSIITNKHILTAAHCFTSSTDSGACFVKIPTTVYFTIGDHNQNAASDNLPGLVEPILKKHVNIHPEYNCNGHDNDIAVIELEEPIDLEKYADNIHPICLPADNSSDYSGETATVTGWGSTIGYNLPLPPGLWGQPWNPPNVLHETQVKVLKNSKCSKSTLPLKAGGIIFRDTMICAATKKGFEKNGTSSCQGDSGGPLFVKENRQQHVQIGIVSLANGCASEGNPTVFTRVSKYLDWIKEQVGSETTHTAT